MSYSLVGVNKKCKKIKQFRAREEGIQKAKLFTNQISNGSRDAAGTCAKYL